MKIDLLLQNAQVYNAYFRQFIAGNVAIKDGRFLYIGTENIPELVPDRVLDIQGKYIIPGLIDCHMHIESSMAAPFAFTREIIRDGVTTIIAEPHEIANVFGFEGIKALMEAAEGCPVDVRLAIPSSVPSTNAALETTGADINREDVSKMLAMEQVVCLGEVMNCREVIGNPDSKSNQLIHQVHASHPEFPIEGHCPAFTGYELARILYAGVDSDHTEQTVERLQQRIAGGMFIELQDKTLRPEIIEYLVKNDLFEHFAIVTDDTMPDVLVQRGHLNYLVKKAMQLGLTPEQAIYAATFTPARRMGLRDKGSIAPGKIADFVVLDDPVSFKVEYTFRAGREVYNAAAVVETEEKAVSFPAHFYHSVHLKTMQPENFCLYTEKEEGIVNCRVLCVNEDTTFVQEKFAILPVKDHEILWESSPYALAAVVERYGKNGGCGYALVDGVILKKGAAATTYAHDHHNLIVFGQNKKDMVTAANTVIDAQGGYAAVLAEKVLAFVPLPIAGILSDEPIEVLARKMGEVQQVLRDLGYRHANVIMSLSTLGLPVSPAFKVTDKGIVDVKRQCIVPLVVENL
jgi:adenine deaminase